MKTGFSENPDAARRSGLAGRAAMGFDSAPMQWQSSGMIARSSLVAGLSLLAFSTAFGGIVSQSKPKPAKQAASAPTARADVEQQKQLLGRLLKELERSPRSFVYLRSIGFTQTDQEFERLITDNGLLFRPTRIVRRDEKGNRQIPGWPGITLSPRYKSQLR